MSAGDDSKAKGLKRVKVSGSGLRICVINTRWNTKIIESLTDACVKQLKDCEVNGSKLSQLQVPGAFELPYAASQVIKKGEVDAVICIGCLIKGETMHFEYICESVSHALMRLGIDSGIPVIFGVLTCVTEEQALQRAGLVEGHHNHGPEWADAAIEMAQFKDNL